MMSTINQFANRLASGVVEGKRDAASLDIEERARR